MTNLIVIRQVLNVTQKWLKLKGHALMLEQIVVLERTLDPADLVLVLDLAPGQLTLF